MNDTIVRLDPAAESERETRELGTYGVIKHSIGLGASYPYERRYEARGDHLYVAELNTGSPVWVKLGARRNPWIRVRVGDVIKRRFSTIWIRAKLNGEEQNRFGQCLFYFSEGPLLERRPNSYGLSRGFLTWGAALTATPRTLSNLLSTASPNGAGIPNVDGLVDLGREPVALWVTNMDGSLFLLVGTGSTSSVPAAADMFAIPPSSTFKIEIDSSLRGGSNEVGDGSTVVDEIYFAGTGSISARFLLTKFGLDVTRQDSDLANITVNGPRPFSLED